MITARVATYIEWKLSMNH